MQAAVLAQGRADARVNALIEPAQPETGRRRENGVLCVCLRVVSKFDPVVDVALQLPSAHGIAGERGAARGDALAELVELRIQLADVHRLAVRTDDGRIPPLLRVIADVLR